MLGDKRWTATYVCEEIRRDMDEHGRLLGCEGLKAHVPQTTTRWNLPPPGFVSLMVDEAYNHNQHCMGMGGLVRDATWTWLGRHYAGMAGGDPFYAEVQALVMMGLRFLWRKNWRKVISGIDCLDLVRVVGKGKDDFHQYNSVLMDIKICHVPREGNKPADCLAEIGMSLQCVVMDLISPPEGVISFLQEDLSSSQ